jgi:small-conductance mechanosensitive channel
MLWRCRMNVANYLQQVGSWFMGSGLKIFLIIIATLIVIKSAQIFSTRLFETVILRKRKEDDEFKKRTDTLNSILRYIINISIVVIAVVMILGELGIEIGPILAAAGVLGLAVGFGAQSLVKDIISGFFIFLEDQIRVGDYVDIADKAGIVERLNLKMTILRDFAGNVHFVPNGEIAVVTNMTKGFSRYLFEIGVAYREDVDEVMEVMREVDKEIRNDSEYASDILEPLEILGLDQFADSALVIKARTKTRPLKQWRVAREFNRRLKKKFDENNIEIPFPHRTVYIGKDKQGQSAPLNISIEKDRS